MADIITRTKICKECKHKDKCGRGNKVDYCFENDILDKCNKSISVMKHVEIKEYSTMPLEHKKEIELDVSGITDSIEEHIQNSMMRMINNNI